jgi:hypothetical protein
MIAIGVNLRTSEILEAVTDSLTVQPGLPKLATLL